MNRTTRLTGILVVFCLTLISKSNPVHAGRKIDINTAAVNQVEKLEALGPQLAKRIVEFRNKNGPFQSIEDVTKVQGIGTKWIGLNAKNITFTDKYRCGYCSRIYTFKKGAKTGTCPTCGRRWPYVVEKAKTTEDNLKKPYLLVRLITGIEVSGELPIHLGDSFRSTLQILKATPQDEKEKELLKKRSKWQVFYIYYPDISVQLKFLRGYLYYISCGKRYTGTLAGVRVGDNVDKAKWRFGKPSFETRSNRIYNYLGQQLDIIFDPRDNKVTNIMFYNKDKLRTAQSIMTELKGK